MKAYSNQRLQIKNINSHKLKNPIKLDLRYLMISMISVFSFYRFYIFYYYLKRAFYFDYFVKNKRNTFLSYLLLSFRILRLTQKTICIAHGYVAIQQFYLTAVRLVGWCIDYCCSNERATMSHRSHRWRHSNFIQITM